MLRSITLVALAFLAFSSSTFAADTSVNVEQSFLVAAHHENDESSDNSSKDSSSEDSSDEDSSSEDSKS